MTVQRKQITELEGHTITRVDYDHCDQSCIKLMTATGMIIMIVRLTDCYDEDGFHFATDTLDERG